MNLTLVLFFIRQSERLRPLDPPPIFDRLDQVEDIDAGDEEEEGRGDGRADYTADGADSWMSALVRERGRHSARSSLSYKSTLPSESTRDEV